MIRLVFVSLILGAATGMGMIFGAEAGNRILDRFKAR